jgi:hypothetical protein
MKSTRSCALAAAVEVSFEVILSVSLGFVYDRRRIILVADVHLERRTRGVLESIYRNVDTRARAELASPFGDTYGPTR